MKFTLPWLKEHLETDASLDAICARLTMLGLEVEGVDRPAAPSSPPSASPMCARRASTRTPTGCACARSRPGTACSRSSAARPTRAPA